METNIEKTPLGLDLKKAKSIYKPLLFYTKLNKKAIWKTKKLSVLADGVNNLWSDLRNLL